MWKETSDGELYFPFNRDNPADHLRVWPLLAGTDHEGWYGDLLFDGDYVSAIRVGPFMTRDEARDDLVRRLIVFALAALMPPERDALTLAAAEVLRPRGR